MDVDKVRIGVVGASGYTGADLVRLAACHPHIEMVALTAHTHAGKPLEHVFPHLGRLDLPDLVTVDAVDWAEMDVVFCCLPHGTSQTVVARLLKDFQSIRVVDLSADFRLRDPGLYERWYGRGHDAVDLQREAVYGLTEHYREAIGSARLVACPGCYPTAALMLLLPLVQAGLIDAGDLVIDAKSGISGAGRAPKENVLFAEAGEGLSPYGVGRHRHAPEIEQELSIAARDEVVVSFTPHLVPMSRGELVTCYARLVGGATADALRARLAAVYERETFVRVLPKGKWPGTQHVRGSNFMLLSVEEDRISGRVVLFSVLDNLVKGSSGQALQNMNIMFGFEESLGLTQYPLFP